MNEKKPVVLLMMQDGQIKEVVSDTKDGVEVLMVNICSPGSPQEDVQEVKITLPDGEVCDLHACIVRLGVKIPKPGDTVIEQFRKQCPEGEYSIDRIEVVPVSQGLDGKVAVRVGAPIADFAEIYAEEFGEVLSPNELKKYLE